MKHEKLKCVLWWAAFGALIAVALSVVAGCNTEIEWGRLKVSIPAFAGRSFDSCEAEVMDPNGLHIRFHMTNYENAGMVPIVDAAVTAAVKAAVKP